MSTKESVSSVRAGSQEFSIFESRQTRCSVQLLNRARSQSVLATPCAPSSSTPCLCHRCPPRVTALFYHRIPGRTGYRVPAPKWSLDGIIPSGENVACGGQVGWGGREGPAAIGVVGAGAEDEDPVTEGAASAVDGGPGEAGLRRSLKYIVGTVGLPGNGEVVEEQAAQRSVLVDGGGGSAMGPVVWRTGLPASSPMMSRPRGGGRGPRLDLITSRRRPAGGSDASPERGGRSHRPAAGGPEARGQQSGARELAHGFRPVLQPPTTGSRPGRGFRAVGVRQREPQPGGAEKLGSTGSVTSRSRSQPSFCSVMDSIATPLALASSSGKAWYSDTQQR